MPRFTGLSLVFALLAAPTAAARPGPEEPARRLYEQGLGHYNIGEYDDAIAAWKEAYRLSQAPLLLFDIGQAFRLKGDCLQAMRFYRTYVREAPSPKNRSELASAMRTCSQRIAASPPSEPAPEETQTPVAETTPPAPAPSAPAAREAPAPPGRRGRITGGLVTAGAGVALAGAGAYFALRAASDADRVQQHRGPWDPAAQALQDSGQENNLIATTLFCVGAAAIVTGGVLWFLGVRAERLEVGAAPLPGGMGLALSARF